MQKTILLLGLFAYFALQLRRSILKIVHPSSSTAITYASEETFELPSFTICQVPVTDKLNPAQDVPPFDPDAYQGFVEAAYLSKSVETRLSPINLKQKQHVERAGYNHSLLWGKYYSPWTSLQEIILCETLNIKDSITPNPFLYLTFRVRIHKKWKVHLKINDRNQMVTIGDKHIGSDTVAIHRDELPRSFVLKQTIEENENWSHRPCNEDGTAMFQMCIEQYIVGTLDCVPPWILRASFEGKEACEVNGSYFSNLVRLVGFLTMSPIDKIIKVTGCLMNCRYTRYEIQFHDNSYFEDNMVMGPNLTVFTVQMPDQTIKKESEVRNYDWNTFIADIGGFLGLLLGLSIPDIYDMLVTGCQKFSKYFQLY